MSTGSPLVRRRKVPSPSVLLPDLSKEKTEPESRGDENKRRFSAITSGDLKTRGSRSPKDGVMSPINGMPSHRKHSRSYSLNGMREKTLILPDSSSSNLLPTTNDRPKSPGSSFLSPNSSVGTLNVRRKSIGQPDSRLVVLGIPGVGKSAVVVRILTGRFIWEYDPTLEAIYRYHTTIDDEQSVIEILDTACGRETDLKEGYVKWGDGFLIVYSLTDRKSFLAVPDIHAYITSIKNCTNFPCVLLANKADLEHMFKVSKDESIDLATKLDATLFEASANEGSQSLWEAISELHREVIRSRGRRRRSSAKVVFEGFYKIMGNLFPE